jgi:heme-degrading monooxygenase HmoA
MYARVITAQNQPGKVDEAVQIYRESMLPEARQQPGFKGAMMLVDRSTGKGTSITLWQTVADGQASGTGSAYLQAQIAKAASLLAAAPIVETYEVSIQEVQQGGPGGHARVLTATAHPGKTDEGVQIVRDSLLPVTRQQPGYKGYLALTDRTTGKVISITLWETEADLNASESSGLLREQLGKVAYVLATQVVREVYEVAVQE